jgi:hypothetical protein
MREYVWTIVNGPILHGSTVLMCPRDRTRTGLKVAGYLGKAATITCPCGHEFDPPRPFDAVHLLRIVTGDPRRKTTHLSYGELPN